MDTPRSHHRGPHTRPILTDTPRHRGHPHATPIDPRISGDPSRATSSPATRTATGGSSTIVPAPTCTRTRSPARITTPTPADTAPTPATSVRSSSGAPPHGPTGGGLLELVHHVWRPTDILPGDPKSAAQKQYEFGIGPGCTNEATGQAVPHGRILDVCQSLDLPGELRCCVESICDPDFSGAMECLADMLARRLTAD